MKKACILSTVTLTTLLSCAGTESYEQKMSRYSPRNIGKNQVPEISSTGFQFKGSKNEGRTPASSEQATRIPEASSDESTLSNKKLYFLTLLGQYESLKKYGYKFSAPSINICPHFHNSLLEHNGRRPSSFTPDVNKKIDKIFVYDRSKLNDVDYVAKRPELSLPVVSDEIHPKVIDLFRSEGKHITDSKTNEIVHRALDLHLSKTYAEIRELCEYGVSNNYYIYENLITHIKNSPFQPIDKNMNTLLKTTLFSNIALVTSLEKIETTLMRSIASEPVKAKDTSMGYSNEVMVRLNVEWAQEYFEGLKK